MAEPTAGERFRRAIESERPLQIVGAINAYSAMQAAKAGFQALYLSGAGVANAAHGLPDLGVTTLNDVAVETARIAMACPLPLLVDIDTGWGTELTIRRAIRELESAGAAGVHIEDQIAAKRCGHRPGKSVVETEEMIERLRAALGSRHDKAFVIMARTDAVAVEGIERAIERCQSYVAAGADMIFAEAVESLDGFREIARAVQVPILANMTEFGRTPAFTGDQLADAGVRMALYPLTAFRAMNQAAKRAYETIRQEGTQRSILDQLQTREQLYEVLDYYKDESRMDQRSPKP